jgi:CRISPR-associated protein Csd1
LKYIAPKINEKRHIPYVEQLRDWVKSEYSHPMLVAILRYIEGETLIGDLRETVTGIFDKNGDIKKNKESEIIRWRVNGLGVEGETRCWVNETLFDLFILYYKSKISGGKQDLCMITGELSVLPEKHPRGLFKKPYGAKLISSNDTDGYTYRGRFTDASQAATVSYIASQKAHNALRWLIAEQGVKPVYGEALFLCWNPQGKPVQSVGKSLLFRGKEQFASTKVSLTNYKKRLASALLSYKNNLPDDPGVVIAALDVTSDSTGRLSLVYYNELQNSDFLQRLYDWDVTCCWDSRYGVHSPALYDIVKYAFGTLRKNDKNATSTIEVDKKIVGMQMRRLVSCRVDRMRMPEDIAKALVQKASRLLLYDDKFTKNKESRYLRSGLLSTACAVLKKYRYDVYKEEWEMSLEPEKKDRSYQFGRLLAVLEKAERDAYRAREKRKPTETGDKRESNEEERSNLPQNEEKRETNAIRMQSIFIQRPLYASHILCAKVKEAYFPYLWPRKRDYYDKLIGEIIEQLSGYSDSELGKPVSETYLFGYYLQRNELNKSKKEKEMEEE